MQHIIIKQNTAYKVALLLKPSIFNTTGLMRNYANPLAALGVPLHDQIAFDLAYDSAGKAPVSLIKSYLDNLLIALNNLGITHLYVTDGAYFKVLTKMKKADAYHGYALPCAIKGFEHMHVVFGVNYQQVMFDPSQQGKLDAGLHAVASHLDGTYEAPGSNIIHFAEYPETYQDIKAWLLKLYAMPELKIDIEGFSLKFKDCGIGTIAFAWSQHEGVAFTVDYEALPEQNDKGEYGQQVFNVPIRRLLKEFFQNYKGRVTWHFANFDVKVLIYQLFMDHPLDYKGMLEGLDCMCFNMDDTKLITYLATNSCAGNVLALKPLAQEFAGNWAQDEIKDIRKIALPQLLQYNLVDCLSTAYVENKYWPMMVRDNQLDLYQGLFKDSQKMIIQTELVGMPMNPDVVKTLRTKLAKSQQEYLDIMLADPIIAQFNTWLQTKAMNDANAELKTKQHPLSYFSTPGTKHYKSFNPNSGPQLQVLLFEMMGLPVVDLTDGGNPATGGDVLEELAEMPIAAKYKHVLEALVHYGKVTKIISGFLPAFEAAFLKGDGMAYLHGSFNLGGAVSGRLSSSDPNLQNIPANSTYAKAIKEAFMAALGWVMCGADFRSLEDYISALTSKDPNKLKVYTDGYDGHSLRAFSYFPEKLPGIIDTVESINSIKKLYDNIRYDSKAPTFLLTYGGTYHGLMKNCGFSKPVALGIEANYHSLYAVSDKYIEDRLKQATKDGYVEVAFGLRVRTPVLKQTILGTKSTPYQAKAEGRTAGNAMGQSYGLLNNRAGVATMKRVWASKYRYDIMPIALIHDALYFIIRQDAEIIAWFNNVLIEEMEWCDLPELYHPTVKIGADLDLFYPSWAKPLTLPNKATPDQITKLCKEHMAKLKEAA